MLLNFLRHMELEKLGEVRILLREGGELEADFAGLAPTFIAAGETIRPVNPENGHQEVFPTLSSLLEKWRPNLVYSNTITNGSVVRAVRGFGIPVIVHVQETKRAFLRHAADYVEDTLGADHFICVSWAVQQYLRDDFNIPEQKLTLIHNSVDPQEIARSISRPPEAVRDELNIPRDAMLIGGMGWVKLGKGVDLWLQAARRVVVEAATSNPYFLWIGQSESDFADEMQRNLSMMGLQDRVVFTGVVGNPYPYLNSMDIFVMSSRYEAIGLVVIEAAFLKKPVVYFRCAGGPGEVISDDAGIGIDNLDSYELAQGVISLINDPLRRYEMGLRGWERVVNHFDVRQKAPLVHCAIEQMISRFYR